MDVAPFLTLETQVWEALRTGDPAADKRMLSDDFLGVYATGFAGRDAHAAALANGPTVAAYALDDARIVVVTDDDVLLCYRAKCRGADTDESAPMVTMYISSLWSRRDGEWVNVFSQDTAAAK